MGHHSDFIRGGICLTCAVLTPIITNHITMGTLYVAVAYRRVTWIG